MKETVLCERHSALGARMVDFAGWLMPIQYPKGIVAEHLATRLGAGLFDVSHMGRFQIRGRSAVPFLQSLLTNNVLTLTPGQSQYTILANPEGGAIDDAYVYQLAEGGYLLVVNASNAPNDWEFLRSRQKAFDGVEMTDVSNSIAMLALQGPESEHLLSGLLDKGHLPPRKRNALSEAIVCGTNVIIARTGYTGEPVCFELFISADRVGVLWDALIARGADPVGLGARDTLRLEAALPLYGHEFGIDPNGRQIPVLACPVARYGVSFDANKGDYTGKAALLEQAESLKRYAAGDFSNTAALPAVIRPFRLAGGGIARAGAVVYDKASPVGYVTSGTMAPYWVARADGDTVCLTEQRGQRALGLAMVAADVPADAALAVDVRGRKLTMQLVRRNLENRKSETAFAVIEQLA